MLHSAWFSTCALALPLYVCGLYISKCPRVQSSGLSFSISQSWLHKIITWRTFNWKSAHAVSQSDHLSQHLRVLGLDWSFPWTFCVQGWEPPDFHSFPRSAVPRPLASLSTRNLLEMQILQLQPKPLYQNLGVGPSCLRFTSPPGD